MDEKKKLVEYELICRECKNICTHNVGIYYGKYDVTCRGCMFPYIRTVYQIVNSRKAREI
jgi:hypothetical protein